MHKNILGKEIVTKMQYKKHIIHIKMQNAIGRF